MFCAVGVVCGLLGAFFGGVLHQPWPTLVALFGAFLSVAIALVLGIGAFPSVYSDIRYASSGRAKRTRSNGEGSIFPSRNGFAAYVWVDKPDGKRARKYIYGQTRDIVHDKWIKLQSRAAAGPVATKMQTLGDYLAY